MAETVLQEELRGLVRRYFEQREEEPFVPGRTRIPLITPSFGWEEVWEALESLLSTRVTMGEKVRRFEAAFAQYIGVRHAVMVNSGSSANLLALSILTNPTAPRPLLPGEEVITPAVTWATTVWPILNVGLVPVLVDVDLNTFNLIPEEVEKAITTKSRAIMLVHLLGNPCAMDQLTAIARRHNLMVIEDACEAHGAEYRSKKVGAFGELATFSFFFSHHISTIEGGMIVTSRDDYAELARSMRVFGWVRDLKDRVAIAQEHSEIDARFLFVNVGYNLRPTEVQGAFGIHQMGKLERYVAVRRENARYWGDTLGALPHLLLHREAQDTRHVWFGYPVVVQASAPFSRKQLTDFLEARGVETRPIMAGNIAEQPGLQRFPYRTIGDLPNSRLIHRSAFFFGNHHGIGTEEREAIAGYFREFIGRAVAPGRRSDRSKPPATRIS